LDSYRQKNVLVRVFGRVALDDIEEAVLENVAVYKPALVAVNKFDQFGDPEILKTVREVAPVGVEVVGMSCLTGIGVRELPQKLFALLDIIRVYTREPNDPAPSPEPFVVRRGTTTGELAKVIHSQLYEGYRFARVWGSSSKFPGERVGPSHILEDKDVVEIHA
jgi:ribosome-interacting GTPase 1